jgi:hypothetical protein
MQYNYLLLSCLRSNTFHLPGETEENGEKPGQDGWKIGFHHMNVSDFPRSLRVNASIVPWLGHARFLLNLSQSSIINHPTRHNVVPTLIIIIIMVL